MTALADKYKKWAFLYEGIFWTGADTPLRLWTGRGALTWNGFDWFGAGQLLDCSPVEEVSDIRAVSFTVSLSGLAPGIVDLAENSIRSGKPGRTWLALFDVNDTVIPDPYPLRRGKFDTDTIVRNGDMCTVTVQYESVLSSLDRAHDRRWTDADQKLDYPNDRGFEYVSGLQDKVLTWG